MVNVMLRQTGIIMTKNSVITILQPLYSMDRYNTVLDITRFKDGSQKMYRLY